MNSKPDEFLISLYACNLESKLLEYIEAVGPYHTLDDLEGLLSSGPFPPYHSQKELATFKATILNNALRKSWLHWSGSESTRVFSVTARPPFNAEYILYLLLGREERSVVIGDLTEDYARVLKRFNKRCADIWFYKQVGGSLFPLFRRAVLRIGAFVWLGRILRRLIS